LSLPSNSMGGRRGLAVGIIAARKALEFLGPSASYVAKQSYGYDIIYKSLRIDVKALETTRDHVELDDLGDIPVRQYREHVCDVYLMARVNVSLRTCWLIGWIFKGNLLDKEMGRLQKKGSVNVVNNTNDFTYSDIAEYTFTESEWVDALKEAERRMKQERR